jgi:predicted ATPase/serine/threonine protein kinase
MARINRRPDTADSSPGAEVLARLAQSTREQPGRLGRYDVIGLLGRGGMGTVYDALDRERGTRVALKTLSAADVTMSAQLKREFRVVADLAHPSLAPVYELCCEDGLWFFVMERVDGAHFTTWARGAGGGPRTVKVPIAQTLSMPDTTEIDPGLWESQDLVVHAEPRFDGGAAKPPSRPIPALRQALAELVRGVTALHDAGFWHGDIKPSNVLVRADGRVVVVDFGLARPVGEARGRLGPMPGTPLYMSPEQLAGDATGPASDWYAVGTMLYEVLTGRVPFTVGSLLELYFRKSHETPVPPHEIVPEIPRDLSDACMALLRPEPDRRPRGAELLRIFTGDETATLATPERALRSTFVGRQRELSQLEHAYGLARAGKRSVAHVRGPSGIGKSAMVRSFLRGVRHVDQAHVLRGRCYERESVPYKAFDGIIDDLAELLLGMRPHHVEAVLPEWVGELGCAFPALLAVPAVAARAEHATVAREAMELRRRAWIALAELFAALGESRPVVLSIDDLQWADADSALLLDALLRGTARSRLLIVAGFRPEDAAGNAALTGYFQRCRELDAAGMLTDVPLAGLRSAESEQLARATLQALKGAVSEARVRYLAEEARGVPFFIEELARFVATQDPPAVDGEVTLERAISARVRALPAEQRALIEMVAVADTPVPQSAVFAAAGLDAGALPALLALRSASMLIWSGAGADDPVSTYHDRIRESVLAAMDPEARKRRHLALGRALRARHDGDAPGPWVFEVVRHLGAAATLLSDAAERLAAARLHLEAGRLARRSAAFPLAFRCFEGGIALLADDAWDADYDLALGLHGGAAETAYLSAEWSLLEARVAAVEKHGRSVMDQLVAWEVAIDAHIGRHEYLEAVGAASKVLALLDVALPIDPDMAAVGAAFQRALACLDRVGPEGLEALPDVHDARTAAAMRIQIRVSPAAYFGRPMLLPIIAANLIETSVERGLSPATPYALALFGIVLNTAGMYPASHAWGQLAVKLLDRWDDERLVAATRHVVFNLVCTWMVPLHTILGPLREVFEIGRRTGDFEYASYAAHGYAHHALYAARPLQPLYAEALDLGEQMRALGQVNALHVHQPFEQLLKALTGRLLEPWRLDDETFEEEALLAQAAAEGSRSGIYVCRVVMGLSRYWFGKHADAAACFAIARHYADAAPSVWHVPMMHQFSALAACAAWDATPAAERPALRAIIDASLEALRVLAGHAPVNFAHRVSLVEGEIRRIEGDRRGALARFEQAIVQANEAAYVNDIALAHELAAACHDERAASRAALTAARDAYAAWGAAAKAAALTAQIEAID